jgi:putative hydrolase of the HAD superfamily
MSGSRGAANRGPTPAVRAVLVDMGGVLLEMHNPRGLPQGRHDWRGREALLRTLAQSGARAGARLSLDTLESELFAPWRAEYERRYELGREASWAPHLRRLRRATGARAQDLRLLGAWFGPYADTLAPLPGARQALAAFAAAALRVAVVSNVALPGRLFHRVLRRHGLDRGIASFHWSYDAGSRKPSPAMLLAALQALDTEPAEAVMVGDRRRSDVAGGRAAGVRTVWVRSEHREGPAGDWEVDSLAEVPALLASLGAGAAP